MGGVAGRVHADWDWGERVQSPVPFRECDRLENPGLLYDGDDSGRPTTDLLHHSRRKNSAEVDEICSRNLVPVADGLRLLGNRSH